MTHFFRVDSDRLVAQAKLGGVVTDACACATAAFATPSAATGFNAAMIITEIGSYLPVVSLRRERGAVVAFHRNLRVHSLLHQSLFDSCRG